MIVIAIVSVIVIVIVIVIVLVSVSVCECVCVCACVCVCFLYVACGQKSLNPCPQELPQMRPMGTQAINRQTIAQQNDSRKESTQHRESPGRVS